MGGYRDEAEPEAWRKKDPLLRFKTWLIANGVLCAETEAQLAKELEREIIATGARPVEIPGFKFDGQRVVDSTGALAFREVPGRLLVVGGGYISLEIGTLYAKLGASLGLAWG